MVAHPGRDTKAKRDAHYREYGSKPAQIAKRVKNSQARDIMEKKVGKAAMKGKDVHHKRALEDGGTNSPSNLALVSVKKNRGWKDGV